MIASSRFAQSRQGLDQRRSPLAGGRKRRDRHARGAARKLGEKTPSTRTRCGRRQARQRSTASLRDLAARRRDGASGSAWRMSSAQIGIVPGLKAPVRQTRAAKAPKACGALVGRRRLPRESPLAASKSRPRFSAAVRDDRAHAMPPRFDIIVITALFEFERELRAAGPHDPALRHDMHGVGHDIVEQALIMRDDEKAALGVRKALTPSATMRSASMSRPESVSSRMAKRGSSSANCRMSMRFFSPPEKPTLSGALQHILLDVELSPRRARAS